ncbi:MAG TPA: peptidylprolyl isomerase [Rhodocyclaceae bacterium]|jgi:peptidyl-prolyl cis-trans isomerase A (cyclophilin A)|nr:peptidylprolyl isomerase [Rhodocyclaceae bacterium]
MRQFVFAVLALCVGSLAWAANPQVEFKTNQGNFIVEVYPDKTPKTADNFLRYVKDGFYNGTIFHRVIANFMIQGGGFTPDMKEKTTRAPIQNEAQIGSMAGLRNSFGTIAMARTSNPNSATAQFFVNVKDNSFLDYPGQDGYGYAAFGKIIKGMDVVMKIRSVSTRSVGPYDDVPATPVIIESATILPDNSDKK